MHAKIVGNCLSKIKGTMKRYLFALGLLAIGTFVLASGFTTKEDVDLSPYRTSIEEICFEVPTEDQVKQEQTREEFDLFLGKSYLGFKEALAFKESRGDYWVVNPYGYLGKYQFGKSTLALIGIYNTESFLNDTQLQEKAFEANMARNKWILRRDIKRFQGQYIGGVKVTESGMLAAAHLAGAGNVKKYLRSGGEHAFSDAFGTTIHYYLKKFSGYDTSFIVAEKKAKAGRM